MLFIDLAEVSANRTFGRNASFGRYGFIADLDDMFKYGHFWHRPDHVT